METQNQKHKQEMIDKRLDIWRVMTDQLIVKDSIDPVILSVYIEKSRNKT